MTDLFPTRLAQMEPLLPGDDAVLRDLATTLLVESSRFDGLVPSGVRNPLRELLHLINCYYSNLIEGDRTYLYDISRALRNDYSAEPDKRRLQLLARSNIVAQRGAEALLASDPGLNVMSSKFICQVHLMSFAGLSPEYLQQTTRDGSRTVDIVPGRIREDDTEVGEHYPPAASQLPAFLARFEEVFRLDRFSGVDKIIAVAASHQRLVWIHPFLDGNGRASRVQLGLALRAAGLKGVEFWSLPRGFARDRDGYMSALRRADMPRQGDYDGRGALSLRGLKGFCSYFLERCIDQTQFMSRLLEIDTFSERILDFLGRRAAGLVPGQSRLHTLSVQLVAEVLRRGRLPKSEIPKILGVSDRQARVVTAPLAAEGIVVTEGGQKAPFTLGLPLGALDYYFPQLCRDGLKSPDPSEPLALIATGERIAGAVLRVFKTDSGHIMELNTPVGIRHVPFDPMAVHPKPGEHFVALRELSGVHVERNRPTPLEHPVASSTEKPAKTSR